MSFGTDWVLPPSSPIKTPWPTATDASRTQIGPARTTIDTKDHQGDNVAGDGDAGGNSAPNLPLPAAPPAQPHAGGGADAPGGGNDPDNGDDDMEDPDSNESNRSLSVSDEGDPEDPKQAGTGKFYNAQTPSGKQMVKMFKRLCDLTDRDANAIVLYFGIYSKAGLAEFLHDHWKDTFTQ